MLTEVRCWEAVLQEGLATSRVSLMHILVDVQCLLIHHVQYEPATWWPDLKA
jgi:hypothetical protein